MILTCNVRISNCFRNRLSPYLPIYLSMYCGYTDHNTQTTIINRNIWYDCVLLFIDFHYFPLEICMDWLSVISNHLSSWLIQGIVLGGMMGTKQFRIMILPLNEIYPVRQGELRLNSTLHHWHVLWCVSDYIAPLNFSYLIRLFILKIMWVNTQCGGVSDTF